MGETALVIAIRLALGKLDDFVVWRNQTGVATYYTDSGKQMFVPFGLCKGSSDLIGILAPAGRMVVLEVKTPKGRPTKEQLLFISLVSRMGGYGAVVRSVEGAVAAVDSARRGEVSQWTSTRKSSARISSARLSARASKTRSPRS